MDTIPELIEILETMLRTGIVPNSFNESLTETLRNNPEIFEILRNAKCLTNWNDEEKYFDFPWGEYIIGENVKKIKTFIENLAPSSSDAEAVKNFNLNINHIPESHLLETSHERQETLRRWIQLTGQSLPQITLQSFVQIRNLIEAPTMDHTDIKQRFPDIIMYIMQEVKMWRVAATFPVEITKHINRSTYSDSGPKKKLGKFKFQERAQQSATTATSVNANEHILPLSRLDILVCLLSNCYPPVCRDIIHIIGKYPVSLPMVVQDITQDKRYVSFTPYLQNIIFKWERKDQRGLIVHNHLFRSPFRLTLVVRVGTPSSGKCGKGTILNRLFATEHAFSSRSEPGGVNGKPLLLDGTVELMPVTNESCTRDFWNWTSEGVRGVESHYNSSNEILLLANLHGNALEHREIISYLKPMFSSVIVFYMTQSSYELEVNHTQLQSKEFFGHLGEENVFDVLIDPSAECENISDDVIDTSKLFDHSMIEKLYQLTMASYCSKVKNSGNTVELPSVKLVREIKTPKSSGLLTQITSCKRIRQTFKLRKLEVKEQQIYQQYLQLWNDDKTLQTIIKLFIEILWMPIEDRRIGLYHFEKEIGLRSMEESQEPRQQCMALSSKRRELAMDMPAKLEKFHSVYEEEMAKLDEINQSVVGPQHFYRELGRLYCLAQSTKGINNPSLKPIRNLPKYYGELMIDGLAIELLDGDESNINDLWFCAIAHSVCQIKQNLRVFVISILGLQSSGKSTLLNALFGCHFDVSVGRCTRGLFMRLLFLEEKLVEQFKFDAFLIIDTEGLGSPEQISDKLAEEKDRRMATFAMSISNLTIINILGESSREMTAILQIVIIAMARLSNAKIATHVLRVQHVSEKEELKLNAAEKQFFDALEYAIRVAEDKSTETGTLSSLSLTNIKQSLRVVKYFGHFKSGAAPNAPPSEQYQNDIVDLYQTILLYAAKQSCDSVDFCNWHDLAVSYWKALQNEDFAVKFKDIREMVDFLDQESKISNIYNLIDSSFRHHRTKMEDETRKKIESNKNLDSIILSGLENELGKIPVMCNSESDPGSKCVYCCSVEKDKRILFGEMEKKTDLPKTRDSIQRYEDTVRRNTLKHLEQSIHAMRVQKGCLKEVDELITAEINERLKKKKEFSAEERRVIADEIWKKSKALVTQKRTIDPLEDRFCKQIILAYENGNFVDWFVNNTGPILNKTEAFTGNIWSLWQNKKIKEQHLTQLRDEINHIVKAIFSNFQGTNNLENGMVKSLQHSVDGIYNEWKRTMTAFTVEFKNAIHLATLRAFFVEAKKRGEKWKQQYDPLSILYDKEKLFRNTIDVRLKYGFGSESEGTVIADRLCMAILIKANAAGSRRWIENVLGQDWIHNSRNVRLHYFETLAKKVDARETTGAVSHFLHPKSNISKWFNRTVDNYPQDEAKKAFYQTIKVECQNAIDKINQATIAAKIIQHATHYVNSVDGVSYACSIENIHQFEIEDTARLKNRIVCLIEEYCFGDGTFEPPSNDEEILNRSGCMDSCPWCGALCWGRRGHDKNTDSTKKHHTSHQPSGHHGIFGYTTKELSPTSCCEWADNTNMYYDDTYIGKWIDVKASPKYNNWIYCLHTQDEYNDLMKWFFQQIHNEIAARCGVKPAKEAKMREWCISSIEKIMSTLRSKISQG